MLISSRPSGCPIWILEQYPGQPRPRSHFPGSDRVLRIFLERIFSLSRITFTFRGTAGSAHTHGMNRSAEQSSLTEMATEGFESGTAVACVTLGLSFLIGAPGNLLVIWTILRHVKQRSHTIVLILHLAFADLLVLITLPLWIYSLAHSWVFGEAFCKAMVYTVNVCMFSSIFFITLMSVDRFLAICRPYSSWKTKNVINICPVVLWLLALLLGVPSAITQTLDKTNGTEQCLYEEFSSGTQAIVLLCLETLGGFIIPFIILIICNCLVTARIKKLTFNSKQKSMVLVLAVVIAFILCWLPYHIINIIDIVCIIGSGTEHDCVPQSIVLISGALVFISSSVNPVLYVFFARNLKGSLEESRLVRLFREVASQSNRLRELVVQQQSGQRAANTQEETLNSSMEATESLQM